MSRKLLICLWIGAGLLLLALRQQGADEQPPVAGAQPAHPGQARGTATMRSALVAQIQTDLWPAVAPRQPQPMPLVESIAQQAAGSAPQTQTRIVSGQHAQALGGQVPPDALAHRSISLTCKIVQDRDAMELLQSGQAEVAIVATPLSTRNRHAGLQGELLGIELFVVITPQTSPMRNRSRAQLRRVRTGTVTNWSHFGSPAQPSALAVPTERMLIERAQRALITGDRLASSARQMPNDRDVCAFVADNPGALGLVRLAHAEGHPEIRALGIDGARPTLNAYLHGGYPFGSPLLLVTRGPARRVATELLTEIRQESIPLRPGVSKMM